MKEKTNDCPLCGNMKTTGITRTQKLNVKGNRFRVFYRGIEGPFTDHKSLTSARASACGNSNAIIHDLLPIRIFKTK